MNAGWNSLPANLPHQILEIFCALAPVHGDCNHTDFGTGDGKHKASVSLEGDALRVEWVLCRLYRRARSPFKRVCTIE